MQELTDDQLDGLFRKSAEEFEPPFDPAAWQAMQSQLDDQNQSVFWRNLLRLGLPVLLLLLLVGSWYVYHTMKTTDNIVRRQISVSGKNGSEATGTKIAAPAGTGQLKARKRPDGPQNERKVPASGENLTADGKIRQNAVSDERSNPVEAKRPGADVSKAELKPAERPEPIVTADPGKTTAPIKKEGRTLARTDRNVNEGRTAERLAPKAVNRSRPAIQSDDSRLASVDAAVTGRSSARRKRRTNVKIREQSSKAFLAGSYAINDPTTFTKRSENPTTDQRSLPSAPDMPQMSESDRVLYPTPMQLTGQSGQWPVPLGFVDREVVMPEEGESASEQQIKPPRLTGLSVRLVVAPDLTVVGLKNFTRPGTNLGLLAEYQLTPRWSFQAGVLRSTKVYRAETSEYNWMWPVQPESVSGLCNMLDIPLNLRYDVALRPQSAGRMPSRWFVSGGVTTYVMLREDFTYNYTNPADPRIKYRQWSTKTGKYEFSQLNLSVGYERALSRRLAWQVEPFLKVPLKEVGYFKLNLISTGAFFSLRYRF